jgi:outer membrane assembly lipoprotein YfiO
MRARCYYEQIENEQLYGLYNELSLQNFNEITNRFPNSEYAQDNTQKILFIQENIAAKHMNIGMFYLKQKKYLAAIKRFNNVINKHSKSKFTPEALYRLVEIYLTLRLVDDAEKSASVIAFNYPKSIWYEKSYSLFYP